MCRRGLRLRFEANKTLLRNRSTLKLARKSQAVSFPRSSALLTLAQRVTATLTELA